MFCAPHLLHLSVCLSANINYISTATQKKKLKKKRLTQENCAFQAAARCFRTVRKLEPMKKGIYGCKNESKLSKCKSNDFKTLQSYHDIRLKIKQLRFWCVNKYTFTKYESIA